MGGVIIDPSLDCSCGARFTSDGTFFVPQGVTTITIESIGGGGRGGTRTNSGNATGGGGGGAYSSSTIDVIPGEPLKIVVGQGATSVQAGGDSWVSRTELLSDAFILAVGGQSVNNNQTTGAIGGQASEGIGQIKFSGGTGSQGSTTPQNGRGGGGGGAGSATGVGGSATGRNGGSSSGIGGAGGTAVDGPTENGFQGANYGGGGSGSSKNTGNSTPSNGGNGANGYVKISFICPPLELTPCSQVISLGEIGGYYIIEYNCDDIWEAPEGLLEFEVLAIGGGAGGGGRNDGGGGGSGGVVYARANIEPQFVNGLPAGTSYSIVIGNGGAGGTSSNNSTSIGSDGGDSFFDLGGNYEIIAAGGGGGGSTNNGAGRNGRNSSIATTTDFSTSQPEGILRGGAGGGQRRTEGSGVGSGANGSGNGSAGSGSGNGAGGAGGGVNGNAGISGGNNFGRPGGPGIQFSFGLFNTNDFFSAGGGGGGNIGGNGGSSGAGGSGGSNNGLDATTPGSGGGGAEGDSNTGGRGSDGRIYIRYPIFRILPVEYLYFNAKYNSFMRSGDLSWATAKEWENSHFEIERSVNDIKSWTVIDQIEGAGYSDGPVEYSYTDKNLPAAGGNIFYRLRQVDFSGNSSYSVTRAIQVDKVDGKDSWAAYPNPTSGDVFKLDLIDNQAYNDEHIQVRLISPLAGSISFQGRDLREISDGIQQSLQKSSNGVYILEISWGQKIEFLKILKRN
ncbi:MULTISPECIES: T9SS type A sorting domain-containing protein [Rhodonellum]|uniref:T9SS type A sorting domain-containing protein n=1 Tax=Rhodonellum TaxID=336827 RepID=UPI001114270C|nr:MULTISPECIES: T9SS type A sorting domain-containing protein [Rhodonellum]